MPDRSATSRNARAPRMVALAALAAAAAHVSHCTAARAATHTWTGPGVGSFGGSWSVAGNWTPAGVPTTGDTAILPGISSINDTTVDYDYTGPPVDLAQLNVSRGNGITLPHTSILSISGHALGAEVENVGDSTAGGSKGRGTINQSGGVNSSGLLYLGNNGTDLGIYTLSGTGSLAVSSLLSVGRLGTGYIGQSGGAMSCLAAYLGDGAGSNGTYELSGGTVTINSGGAGLLVGNNGNGTLIQSGGTLAAGATQYNLILGNAPGASGVYSLSGGTVNPAGFNQMTVYVGYSGSGTFSQTGGGFNCGSSIFVGYNAGAKGTVTFDGTGFFLANFRVDVGESGAGTFLQSSGNVSIGGLNIGVGTGSSGYYQITAGGVSSQGATIGYHGAGTFAQSGGAHFEQFGITMAAFAGSTGVYTFSGGTLQFQSGGLDVGYAGTGTFTQSPGAVLLSASDDHIGISGVGVYTQNGGLHSILTDVSNRNHSLYLGYNAAGAGTYALNGGSLNVASAEFVGYSGVGTFLQQGGTNILLSPYGGSPQVCLAYNPGSAGYYALAGGALSVFDGPEYVGYSGTATFNQTGGANSAGAVILAANAGARGSYTLSGGSLTAGAATINSGGILNYNAGSCSLGRLTIAGTGSVALSAGGGKTLAATSVAIDATAKLDLNDNAMVVNWIGASPLSTIGGYIKLGYADGAWTGDGISSSAAAAAAAGSSQHRTGLGYAATSPGTVLVRYVYVGDANVDGKVDLTDFTFLAANFNQQTGATWNNGDFNYDGKVDLTDFTFLASNFNQQLPAAGGSSSALGVALPEPQFLSIAVLALIPTRRGRRIKP